MVDCGVVSGSEYIPPHLPWTSTYNTAYSYPLKTLDAHPILQYHQPSAFQESSTTKLPVREFPFMPKSPKRINCYGIPIGPGMSTPGMRTWGSLKPKSILKSPAPKEISFKNPQPANRRVRFILPNAHYEWPLVNHPNGKHWRTSSARKKALSVLQLPVVISDQEAACQVIDEEKNVNETTEEDDKTEEVQDLEKIRHYSRWTSAALRAMHEGHPYASQDIKEEKNNTFEERPDEVSDSNHRYAANSEEYQAAGCAWDRVQTRALFGRRSPVEKDIECVLTTKWPSHLSHPTSRTENEIQETNSMICYLLKEDKLATPFIRQLPRYAGFVPRLPINSELQKLPVINCMKSVTTSTHREFPVEEYLQKKKFAHKSPMSNLVTLKHPHNPFNKIDTKNEPVRIIPGTAGFILRRPVENQMVTAV